MVNLGKVSEYKKLIGQTYDGTRYYLVMGESGILDTIQSQPPTNRTPTVKIEKPSTVKGDWWKWGKHKDG